MTETVRLVLLAPDGTPSLHDRIAADPAYRRALRPGGGAGGGSGLGDAAIVAIVAQGALLGLFRLIRAWIGGKQTTVRVRVQGSEARIQVTGRSKPEELVAEVLRAAGQLTDPRE